MEVSENTRISAIIRHNPKAIDAIAGLSKSFRKLKNPLLRKVLAPRVTLGEAASIGKVRISDMLAALEPLGFRIHQKQDSTTTIENRLPSLPAFLCNYPEDAIATLDVRQLLAEGRDPFSHIMSTLNQLSKESILQLITDFQPIPLIRTLRKKGWDTFVQEKAPDLVYTYIKKQSNTEAAEETVPKTGHKAFNRLEQQFEGAMHTVDVRGLEMPQPMITILETMESIAPGEALYVHHQRIPHFLFPELDERNYRYAVKEADSNNVKLIIYPEA